MPTNSKTSSFVECLSGCISKYTATSYHICIHKCNVSKNFTILNSEVFITPLIAALKKALRCTFIG